jgi:sulfur-oxidizing protein SoxB
MTYTCEPAALMGKRIQDMRFAGRPIAADKRYKVAGWASVTEGAQGEPIWDVVARWLRDHKTVAPRRLNSPKLPGLSSNPGLA